MNNSELENRIKQSLELSIQAIDDDTRKRLADIRRQSLQGQSSRTVQARWLTLDFWSNHYWLPVTLLVLSVAFTSVWLKSTTHITATSQADFAMLELLDNPDELETMSDPDFYLWAEETLLAETENAL